MDPIALITALGGLAGVAALLRVIFMGRSDSRRVDAEGAEIAARAMASLQEVWADTLERNSQASARAEASVVELEQHVRRLEEEMIGMRAENVALRESLEEAVSKIDAALAILEGTRDPAGEAAANVLKKPARRKKVAAKKKGRTPAA